MTAHPPIMPVILSGGSGTRLWPLSTPECPKQFLPLAGPDSMFSATLARVEQADGFSAPLVVCGTGHVAHVERDCATEQRQNVRVLVEPAARNTAPAIALAALAASSPDTPMLVMPSDHVMRDPAALLAGVAAALPAVRDGALATFGIAPAHAETGYGYIAMGDALDSNGAVHRVSRFIEKPNQAHAKKMLADGGYFWNAGIFLMRADAYLNALDSHAPAIADAARLAMARSDANARMIHPDATTFLTSPSVSIDYAVMEKAANVVVAPVDPGWSDVGGWAALHALSDRDDDNNAIEGDAIVINARGNLIRSSPGIRVAAVGVDDLVIIATGTDILIIPRDRAQEVKAIVERI
jgi:mannose-1-phosphate guanylyltransferase